MAPIRYSLHYEDYSEHLMSRFGKLLQMQSLVDMTLMCSSHTLRVHKAVLAASSAYFQEVLQKQVGEPLIILKMRFSVLKCLVEFMYCGKTQCLEEHLDELVSAAQFLKIKGLSKVTKEGLGITNNSDLPVFTPPVVINRPPQSLIDLHSQDNEHKQPPAQVPATSTSQPVDNLGRTSKDMVVRIPFDIENGGTSGVDYADMPRAIKPRRGRPSVRRSGGWEGAGSLGRAAERALLRREQDSRKAIHQLKNLQSRHMQDYMDRVTLSQAVNSICGPETPSSFINMENDLMYMDQTVSSNVLDPTMSYVSDNAISENMASSYNNTITTTSTSESASDGISNAMSQYVNALKNAGLPTDLPILFESGDGSYINVNEQVLLDMVQSSEIQYEVIEQPNIIEKVADPSEIKSIDDLSKSIERGELMLGGKSYTSTDFAKDTTEFTPQEDAINSLNAILPDNLDSFADQQNYVVMDPRIQDNHNAFDNVNNDLSCIDGDMQFFTKSMSDDVKKYYEDQQATVMEQFCPTSTLDTTYNMSLLDTKSSDLNENLKPYSLNAEDLERTEDGYDFSLQQNSVFKGDVLDCLMATPRRNEDDNESYDVTKQLQRAHERDAIINDLMNIENNMNMSDHQPCTNNDDEIVSHDLDVQNYSVESANVPSMKNECSNLNTPQINNNDSDLITADSSSDLQWDNFDIRPKSCESKNKELENTEREKSQYDNDVVDLTETSQAAQCDQIFNDTDINKENEEPNLNNNINSTVDDDIPYAVGLLPLKQVHATEDSYLKRKNTIDEELLGTADSKCLKRKAKIMKL